MYIVRLLEEKWDDSLNNHNSYESVNLTQKLTDNVSNNITYNIAGCSSSN
jgi:hypothetical protein